MTQSSIPFERPPIPAAHMRTGRDGESTSKKFLRHLGYNIMAENVRVGRRDEIDLIAFDPVDHVIVFAEVKTRRQSSNDYHPEMNITYGKRQSLKRAARLWVQQHDWDGGYRIDLLYVVGRRVIQHVQEMAWD